MRTDTATFRANVLKSVRALGINSARSKVVARRIASGVAHGSYNRLGELRFAGVATFSSLDLKLTFCWNGAQVVDVLVDGADAFSASTDDCRLVSLDPTPEQERLRWLLERARSTLCDALSSACLAWEEAHGRPHRDEDRERRDQDVELDPAVSEARDAYASLRARSLASNRHAHVCYVDPALHSLYSDVVKEDRGSRPTGHVRYDEAVEYLERSQDRDPEFGHAA